jgi:hypothetical protein
LSLNFNLNFNLISNLGNIWNKTNRTKITMPAQDSNLDYIHSYLNLNLNLNLNSGKI